MGMYDESWCASCGQGMAYTPDESAMCGACATEIGMEYAETLIKFIEHKLDEYKQSVIDINEKYGDGDMFDNDDSQMLDYYEGAIEALDIIHHKAKDMYDNGI